MSMLKTSVGRKLAMALTGRGFVHCGNHYECKAACPKGLKARFIAKLNREFLKATVHGERGAA